MTEQLVARRGAPCAGTHRVDARRRLRARRARPQRRRARARAARRVGGRRTRRVSSARCARAAMERRSFLGACALLSGAALARTASPPDAPPRLYARTRLVDDARRAAARRRDRGATRTTCSSIPYAATPCFLLRLGAPVATGAALRRQDGTAYAWQRRRGARARAGLRSPRSARTSSRIRRARCRSSATSASARRRRAAHVIHCCADHSVYDPAEGARVVAGPAPQPLAAIVLEHDRARDGCTRSARWAPSSSTRSSRSTGIKLALEYGSTAKRARAGRRARPSCASSSTYCRNTIQC